jgi:hypothetical protein
MKGLDSIDNASLIMNGLQHIAFEGSLTSPSYFRVAREAHLVLYRSMIEALKGTANLTVTGRLPKQPSFRYQMGRDPWREIHKEPVPGCKRAWRFSVPADCEPPDQASARAEEPDDHLIGFYDALAMIQTDCFMGQFVHSKPVPVADDSMATLEWLHERVRNEYEHFVPKYYSSPVIDLVAATDLCLRLAQALVFESGNVRLEGRRSTLQKLFAQTEPARTGTM